MDTLPYGNDVDGTLPMPMSPTSLPADVAAAVAREFRDIDVATNNPAPTENDVPEEPVPQLNYCILLIVSQLVRILVSCFCSI